MISEASLAFLSAMELRESALLTWGATGAEWTEAEMQALLSDHQLSEQDFHELLDMALVVQTPHGGYRTRSAETVRLLASLRQSFASRPVTDGRRLVLDYRFLHRPRRRPARSEPRAAVLDEDLAHRDISVGATARVLLPPTISGFQRRSLNGILAALEAEDQRAVMVSAGTGSGKTLAFYLPVLAHTVRTRQARGSGTTVLAVYPRNELLKDQLRTLLWYVIRLARDEPGLPTLRIGAWFGPTPYDAFRGAEEPPKAWRRRTVEGKAAYLCPFLTCPDPDCGGDLLWSREDMKSGRHRLVCIDCGLVVDEKHLNLTRVQARHTPPDVMLTTTESLNRQLSSPSNLRAFGVSPSTLKVVLLDEVHVYQGVSGAQNAYLFRRLTEALKQPPTWVALSATLSNAEAFLAQIIGVRIDKVTLVTPELDEMEEAGAEYLLALRHDPTSGAGTLSTTIQTIMALTRSLDPLAENPFDPPVDSMGIVGKKVFAFTDKLDVTNRLFWDLNDAEGWAWPGQVKDRQAVLTLAHLRSATQDRLSARLREDPNSRDGDGQWWWLAEHLGHGISEDRQLDVDRTSSQDRGVRDSAQVVVATSTLEVGYDDSRIGAVVQHKAPHSAASFLQRKGRAGRDQKTRPWTVVVLSDWGRDREAWLAYDWLFSPRLPATRLPLDNRYIQRIQAVYALMDWISREIPDYRSTGTVWGDLTAPADVLGGSPSGVERARARQASVAKLLGELLGPGPSVTRLRRHLVDALGLPNGDRGDQLVDELLWDGPRPLLLAVVPTILRRLQSGWDGERPDSDADDVKHRMPMREFVPGNLFGDLMATDVLFTGPGLDQAESPYLPVLRTLRDFMPGTVSRHFGVTAKNKRHWIPVPSDAALVVDASSPYQGSYQCTVQRAGESALPVYAPTQVSLESVPGPVRDFSRVEAVWDAELSSVGAGRDVDLPATLRRVFADVTAFLHSRGDGVRVVRFARGAKGAVFAPERQDVQISFVLDSGEPAGLGQEMLADGMRIKVPQPHMPPISAAERAEWLLWLINHAAPLDGIADRFARQTLGEAALVVSADRARIDASTLPELAEHLLQAANALGRVRARDVDHHSDDADNSDDALGFVDADWITDSAVVNVVENAINVASGDSRSDDWSIWWQQRYTITAASVLLDAVAGLAEGVDVEDLDLDLVLNDPSGVWVTETGPGGLGAIEALVRAITENANLVGFAVDNALAPSDLEQLDGEIMPILNSSTQSLRDAMDGVRGSWTGGHSAAQEAMRILEGEVKAMGLPLSSTTQMALTSRVLAPGASSSLDSALSAWIALRDELRAKGVDLDARGLAAVASSDAKWDDSLHLDGPSRATRARRIANLLWPWGREASGAGRRSTLNDQPVVSPADLRALIDVSPPTLVVATWDTEARARAEDALATYGTVRLRFDHGRDHLRGVMLDLQVRPMELRTLLLHPRVVGLRSSSEAIDVWLHLPEVRS